MRYGRIMNSGPLFYKKHSPQDRIFPGLAGEVVRFSLFLKGRGFSVYQSSIHDALHCLKEINISKREDFSAALRANLTANYLEWDQFEGLFDKFWGQRNKNAKTADNERHFLDRLSENREAEYKALIHTGEIQSADVDVPCRKEWLEGVAYSPVSEIETKDLGRFNRLDVQVAELALKKIVEPFKIDVSRRSQKSCRLGNMDFSRVIRNSLKAGGLPVELYYKRKKKRLRRLVILADVSGSMDRYVRIVMPFILGIKGIGSKVEAFVFSTSLSRITFIIRHLSFKDAVERIPGDVSDWSGGTRIGYSLHQFTHEQGRKLLNKRSVIVILSDGWDLGSKELLKREMDTISRKTHCIIWLNPLAGDPDYKPMCKGMKVVLPYVDHFLPADSLQSLKRVGRLISSVMIY